MTEALTELNGQVDLVIANPPYIPAAQWSQLPAEVRDFEPASALVAGADGLAAIRQLIPVARRLLQSGGAVVCEHDDSHGQTAPALFRAAGLTEVVDHTDWTNRPRFVTALQP
jgi:release factor glutamine methyltransferase